ncbi:MAG: hypothetical protein AB1847_22430 [bacterium]
MLHTLKTLYLWCNKHNPLVLERFEKLSQYCNDPEYNGLNRGEKSLHWLIQNLRYKIMQKDLQDVFYYCLLEALVYGEDDLYTNIFRFDIARKYRPQLNNITRRRDFPCQSQAEVKENQ